MPTLFLENFNTGPHPTVPDVGAAYTAVAGSLTNLDVSGGMLQMAIPAVWTGYGNYAQSLIPIDVSFPYSVEVRCTLTAINTVTWDVSGPGICYVDIYLAEAGASQRGAEFFMEWWPGPSPGIELNCDVYNGGWREDTAVLYPTNIALNVPFVIKMTVSGSTTTYALNGATIATIPYAPSVPIQCVQFSAAAVVDHSTNIITDYIKVEGVALASQQFWTQYVKSTEIDV